MDAHRARGRYIGHFEQRQRSPATVRRYRGLLDRWIGPALGTRAPTDIDPHDVGNLLGQMYQAGQSDSSVHQTRTLIGRTNGWKAILNVLTVHYGARITDPSLTNKPPRPLTHGIGQTLMWAAWLSHTDTATSPVWL